jgi:DNA-binding transcriptional ArsR family regulator
MQVLRPDPDSRRMDVQFQVSSAYDLVMSLAAAARPREHELAISWARGVRSALPASSRRALSFYFGDSSALGTGAVQLIPALGVTDAQLLPDAMRSVEPADFAVAVVGRRSDSRALTAALRRVARGKSSGDEDDSLVRRYIASFRAETRPRIATILQDPGSAQERYVALLQEHYDASFRDGYEEVLPFLIGRAKQARRNIGKMPAKDVIARATKGFTLQSPSTRSVTLIPSYYAAPFVVVVRDGRDAVLVYGCRPGEIQGDRSLLEATTLRTLKALADETRLQILQLLVKRPLYGQQLAELLHVSHPTISHHMAQLRIAGLTQTELAEDGSKTYFVRPEMIEMLCTELRKVFVEPSERREGA